MTFIVQIKQRAWLTARTRGDERVSERERSFRYVFTIDLSLFLSLCLSLSLSIALVLPHARLSPARERAVNGDAQ